MNNWKDNIYFVLVETKEAGNIGSSARAMKNMGFKNLCLVNPPDFLTNEAREMACSAIDVVENAAVYSCISEAIKDKSIVIGTTRRIGRQRGHHLPLEEGIKKACLTAQKNKVAILFGREDRGLSNREVEECGFMVSIPTDPLSPSLNLAQSVLLVAYELSRNTYKTPGKVLVKQEELDGLYERIRSTLRLIGYIPHGKKDLEARILRNLGHMIGRSGLTEWELRMLHGICSQVEKKIS